MQEYIGLGAVSILLYLFFSYVLVNVFGVGPSKEPLNPPEKTAKQTNQQVFQEELKKEQKPSGVGFKQLKSQSKAGKKKGKAQHNQPESKHYVSALKGFNSAVADFDYFIFSDGGLLVVIGEESSGVKAFLVKDAEKEQEFKQGQLKLQSGANVLSVSVGPLRVTDSKSFSMMVAVAIFDHCSVQFFDLSLKNDQLVFTKLDKEMKNIHKIPVKTVRLSKKSPQLMVSCGDEQDLTVKLWNLSHSLTEPVNQINTSQIRHKYMTQGHESDFFAIVAKSSDSRIYQIIYNQGSLKAIEKIISLSQQKKEVQSFAFDQASKYCVTSSLDNNVILYSIDEYFKQAKLLLAQQLEVDASHTALAVIESHSQKEKHAYLAVGHGEAVEIYTTTIPAVLQPTEQLKLQHRLKIDDAVSGDSLQQIQLWYDVQKEELYLIASAKLENRINFFKIPQY